MEVEVEAALTGKTEAQEVPEAESSPATPPASNSEDKQPLQVDSSSDEAVVNEEPKVEVKEKESPPAKKAKRAQTNPRPAKIRAPPPTNTLSAIRGPPLSAAAARKIMWDQYQPWVMSTYGDAAKTKTITTKKYARIIALLRAGGGERGGAPTTHASAEKEDGPLQPPNTGGSSSEAAKFRLWVKSKGFHLGPPAGHADHGLPHTIDMLYLPTGTDKTLDGKVHFVYKKVAMVEQFFDIIYSVHVEAAGDTQIRGRAGKHCGQKRTYRAVADQFAFIPREAISKFLLYCIDCQRKNSLEGSGGGRPSKQKEPKESTNNNNNNGDAESDTATGDSAQSPPLTASPPAHTQARSSPFHQQGGLNGGRCKSPLAGQPNMMTPSAAAALSQAMAAMHSLRSMQQARSSLLASAHPHSQLLATQAALLQGGSAHPASVLLNGSINKMGAVPGSDIDLSLPITSTYLRRMRALGLAAGFDQAYRHQNMSQVSPSTDKSDSEDPEGKKEESENGNGNNWPPFGSNGGPVTGHLAGLLSQNGQNGGSASPGLSDHTMDTSGQDDASSNGAKDDDDDDDDDDASDDKMDGLACGDPEKLKAFNMFVRLFVDENLDRHVPISKQPKEKIQAIIDSCTRQFPEYAARARKRIRTYLKSCRRTKRSREQAGLDGANARPTPPHLTSVQAEQLLARACENESENAKRMRMGLEPISQPMPLFVTSGPPSLVDVLATSNSNNTTVSSLFPNMSSATPLSPAMVAAAAAAAANGEKQLKTEYKPEQLASLLQAAASQPQASNTFTTSTSLPPLTVTTSTPANFPGLNGASLYRQSFGQATASFPPTAALLQQQQPPTMSNGPSMETLKKTPLLNHKLNATEISAVRQLVTGYRESAAFLLRSADELEHLLQIQPKL